MDYDKMRDLLLRAGLSHSHVYNVVTDAELLIVLETVVELMDDRPAPDVKWWQNYYEITGEPVVLTENGWLPEELCDDETERLMEVNVA